jgi:hemolysin D
MKLPLPFPSKPIEALGDGALGPVIREFHSPSAIILAAPPGRAARKTIWLIAAMVATMLLIATFEPMDREVTAEGRVISRAPTIELEPLQTAIVRAIDVHVGESVHAGQVLALLDPTAAEADLRTLLARESALAAEVAEERAEFDGKPYKPADPTNRDQFLQAAIHAERMGELKSALENYDQQIASYAAQWRGAETEALYERNQIALASEIERMNRLLEKLDAGSRLTVLQSEQQLAQERGALAQNLATAQATARTLAATKAQRDAFLQQWDAELSSQLASNVPALEAVREEIAKARLVASTIRLRAPQDAVVLQIASGISVGSVMQSGQPFLSLSPLHTPLEIEAYIQGRDQGFVAVGQPVTIKFATFPYALFGEARGTVRVLTSNSFTSQQLIQQLDEPAAQDVSEMQNIPTGELYYGARITIDHLDLHNVPAGVRIIPGMPVETDVRVGTRTLLQYLFERVAPVFDQGMTEPF